VAAVVVLGIAGGAARALSGGTPHVEPTPTPLVTTPVNPPVTDVPSTSPVSPPASTGGSSGEGNTAFIARADTICSGSTQTLADDYNNQSASLSQDTQDLINSLENLGSLPSNPIEWKNALDDWKQAVGLSDPQDWLINMWAGADKFNGLGIHGCGAVHSIGP
jgi:hypothetical protein